MTKKSLVTVVTANQLMADTIARAIGANNLHSGYYLGNGYAVTWTNGEVIEAEYKNDEPFIMASNQDMRQMYAHHFTFKMRNYDALLGWEKSKQDAAQLNTIKALWAKSEKVVNAMEPTFDGELAFLNLYWYLRQPTTVVRAWMPRLRKMAIIHKIANGLRNPEKHEKWLAEQLVNHFIETDCAAKGMVDDDLPATEIVDTTDSNTTTLDEHTEIHIVENQPLYNMVSLWVDATAELGYEFEQTFVIAHQLYAKSLISYPYTYQNGVPDTVTREVERDMRVLALNTKHGYLAQNIKHVSRRNNFRHGECGYNGHGIVTTGLHPVGLSSDEEKLYNLIVKRVIEAFTPTPDEVAVKKKKYRKNHFRKGAANA